MNVVTSGDAYSCDLTNSGHNIFLLKIGGGMVAEFTPASSGQLRNVSR
jgi:hypothetical protein